MGTVYLMLSGKGGTGKTTLSTSIALALAQAGKTVTLLDADIGLRSSDIMLGMENSVIYDAGDVLEKRCTIDEAAAQHPEYPGLRLLAAPQMILPGDIDKKGMTHLVRDLKERTDYVLIDCPAGIGRGIKNVWQAADEAILVVTPDDACVRDAERASAFLFENRKLHAGLILNRIDRFLVYVHEERRPGDIVRSLDMPLLGGIPESYDVYRAVLAHKTALECDCGSVRRAVRATAKRLMGENVPFPRFYKLHE